MRQPLVDLMIIGAQKSATTSLFELLREHPKLAPCKSKEPQFFSHEKDWESKIKSYEEKFLKEDGQIAFEASTSYAASPFHNKNVWQNIHDYNPNTKIIYIVRNPVDRIVSGHRFLYRRGFIKQKNINKYLQDSSYHIQLSKYHYQISPYIETFGKENVLILFFEDFIENINLIKTSISDFLNINLNDFPVHTRHKSNTKEKRLERIVRINKVEKLLIKLSKKLSYRLHQKVTNSILVKNIGYSDLVLNQVSLSLIRSELYEDILNFQDLTNRDLSHWINDVQRGIK